MITGGNLPKCSRHLLKRIKTSRDDLRKRGRREVIYEAVSHGN